jgi:6-phosphogluconolactonase
MKLFRSGIQALLRAHDGSARASMVVGMHSRPAGFDAAASNFLPALVRVARQGRLLSTTSRAAHAPFTFRNPFRMAAPALLALALAACGGGGGGSSTSNSTAPPPPPATYTIGGTVSGLTGTGLVLQDNGGDNLAVSGNGAFTFKTAVNSGAAYAVTVMTQPASPAQTCTVASGSGTATANVTNVAVTCTTAAATNFTIGGTVSGLAGTGLVLQDNGGDNLSVSANGTFTFATAIAPGGAYAVSVATQPGTPAQRCIITAGSGSAAANVTAVVVNCLTTGQFAYTANNADGTISGYTISPTTGQLTAMAGNPVADGGNASNPAAVSLAPNGKFAFSATNKGQQIYAFTVNPTTGVLTPTPHSPFNNPPFVQGHQYPDIAVDPTSKFLYLASFGDNLVVGFSIDQTTGDLTPIGTSFPAGEGAGAIPAFSPNGKFLYVMNQSPPAGATTGNSVSGYSIDPTTGSLTPIGAGAFPAGPNPTWISFRPDGLFAYVSNTNGGNAGSISVYSVDSTGALTAVGSPVPVENGPADLTIDATGTHLYVPNRGSHSISVFSIDPTAGTLTPVGAGAAGAGPGPQLVVIDPTGKYAYASSSYGEDVWGYSIDPTTGDLTPVAGSPFSSGAGSRPLFINIDPSGQFAYTANNGIGINNVFGWTIDPGTGTLTAIPGTPTASGKQPFVVSISPELPGIRD